MSAADSPGSPLDTASNGEVALNGDSVVQILPRWEKARGVSRALRGQRGEVRARIGQRSKACTLHAATDVATVVGWNRPLLP